MEAKFTKGPWDIGANTNTYKPALPDTCARLEALGMPVDFEAMSVGCDGGQMALIPLDESNEANAHLIAAAPEMYKELEKAAILLRLLTVRQVIEAGDDAIKAAGLNPWCMNEGLATGDEPISTTLIDCALAKARGES